jgi:hypothetical protein
MMSVADEGPMKIETRRASVPTSLFENDRGFLRVEGQEESDRE